MYISIAYEIVKKQSKDYFPFKFSYQDLEKDSMGKLVDKFDKFSTNSELVGDLRKIIPLRNLVTHRGLLLKVGEIDNELLNKDIESIVERSKNCLDKLMIEWKKIQELSKKDNGA